MATDLDRLEKNFVRKHVSWVDSIDTKIRKEMDAWIDKFNRGETDVPSMEKASELVITWLKEKKQPLNFDTKQTVTRYIKLRRTGCR